jgi:hypothetical protein
MPSPEAPSPSAVRHERWGRIAARFVIAVAVSAAADTLWWLHQPRQLTGPVAVVGYPTFHNFDYLPSFAAYRLITYAFPVGVLAVYSLLAWRGPLRRTVRVRRARAAAAMLDLPAAEPADVLAAGPALGAAARLLLPAVVVVTAGSTRPAGHHQRITAQGLLCGLAYAAGVLGLAAAITLYRTRSSRPLWPQIRPAIAAVNGVAGAMISVLGLWYISQNSVVVVLRDHSVHHWPWLPGWLAALGMLVIAAWGVLRLRGGRAPAAVEKRLLAVVVGAATVFLITSRMPGQLGRFHGFDDAQNLVGAHLLGKGYFPWRDLFFIHGLWMDALQSTLGFSVFGDTRWGGNAGVAVLVIPACWVIIYLFAVWFSRSNRWFLIGMVLLLLAGIPGALDLRFILVPVSLVLLGEMLRRRSFAWCAAFMVVMFAQTVLVPETLLLALPGLSVVVAADLTHRNPGSRIWPALRRSCWCAAVGAAALAAWCALLAANHSLGAWISYFKVFAPGHDAEGAHPPWAIPAAGWVKFGLTIALVLVTFWSVAARVRAGRPWSPRDWITVAAAGFAALYGEKALGRFDPPHIAEVFTAALPLVLLWSERAVTAADGLVHAIAPGARRSGASNSAPAIRNPATVLVVAITVVAFAPLTGRHSVMAAATSVASHEQARSLDEPTVPRLGYAAPVAVSPSLLRDLGTALDTYAGKSGLVFDMTNGPGYIYFLIDRRPASRFVNIGLAMTPYAQELLIGDLRRSRPPVVVFDSTAMGLPSWDGIRNNVRSYEVSQYLLSGWTPVLRTHGELLLLRNDLMARRPAIPRLIVPPVPANLWFSGPACTWGSIPNFLSSPVSGSAVEIPVTHVHSVITKKETIGIARIPAGVILARYDLLTLHATGLIGPSDLTISDTVTGEAGHDIIAHALPSSGTSLGVRAGSCLQWRGYQSRELYVIQTGGTPVDRLQLSGVG